MKYIYIILIQLLPVYIWSQTDTTHSSELEEFILKSGHNKNYNEGKNSIKIDKNYREVYQTQNTSEQLSLLLPIYIKNYGNNMSAGISMRGTGSEHTAVNWNGININNPMLGVASFSSLFLNLSDQLYIQPGGNSATGGSGAIGGSINLDDEIYLTNTKILQHKTALAGGSFNNQYIQSQLRILTHKFSNDFKILYNSTTNNFDYIDPQTSTETRKINENSGYKSLNLKWNCAVKITKKITFKSYHWLELSQRHLQQGIGTIYSNQLQEDKNYKGIAQLDYKYSKKSLLTIKTAYIIDHMNYSSFYLSSNNYINRWIIDLTHIYNFSDRLSIKSGVINQYYILPNKHFQENRVDAYVYTKYMIRKYFTVNANVRQPMVDQDIKPTCFDLGYKKVFNINSKNALALSQAYNRNYRLPTLNERFWVPGGKVSLLPELSNGIESTLKHTYNTTKSSQMLSATVYTNKVNNWIQWVPTNTGFWEASNAMQVVTNGIEVFEEIYTKYKNVEYGFKVNYIYNYSTNKVIKKQLIYTPYNIFNITATIKYQQWYAIFNYHYTGFRYTSTDNSFWLPSYTLINASIQKSFLYRNHIYTTSIVCNNILNSQYQTIENFAMPGRSLLIKIQFSNK